jgi:hypothetical protein
METTERIVEAYVRYVKGWATIPNIPCKGQFEIDLLAVDPVSFDRYHIESSVSVSPAFSKLTAKPFSEDALRDRVQQGSQRRTLGYFIKRKFGRNNVIEKLAEYGFKPGKYTRVIVTRGWTEEAAEEATGHGIVLWDFSGLMKEIAERFKNERVYFTDDTLRTLNLYAHAMNIILTKTPKRNGEPLSRKTGRNTEMAYWVYENWVHNKCVVHKAACSFCNNGNGLHGKASQDHGRWRGPFQNRKAATSDAKRTGRANIHECGYCSRQR